MNAKTSKLVANIEPVIDSIFRDLANKKGMSCSAYLRALVIDEIRLNGLLPEDSTMRLLKGVGA